MPVPRRGSQQLNASATARQSASCSMYTRIHTRVRVWILAHESRHRSRDWTLRYFLIEACLRIGPFVNHGTAVSNSSPVPRRASHMNALAHESGLDLAEYVLVDLWHARRTLFERQHGKVYMYICAHESGLDLAEYFKHV